MIVIFLLLLYVHHTLAKWPEVDGSILKGINYLTGEEEVPAPGSFVRSDHIWKYRPIANVHQWYQPWEQCILNLTKKATQFKFHRNDCYKETGPPKDNVHAFKCRLGGTYRGRPCISDNKGTYVQDVPFLEAAMTGVSDTNSNSSIIAYDDPNQIWLRTVFEKLWDKNGTFIMFGDSVMLQVCQAVVCEMERTKVIPPTWDLWVKNAYPRGWKERPVKFFMEIINRGAQKWVNRIRHIIVTRLEHHDSAMIVWNQGVWYNKHFTALKDWVPDTTKIYQDDMMNIFNVFYNLALEFPEKQITVAWMESHSQHFNSTTHNPSGYYGGAYDRHREKNSTHGYWCNAMKDTSWAADWRNGEIWDLFPAIVEKWSKLPNLHLTPLHTRSLTMSRHNFHMHTDSPDCTHYSTRPTSTSLFIMKCLLQRLS